MIKLVHRRLVVIDPEKSLQNEVENPEHFVFRIAVGEKHKEQDTFLVLNSSTLNNFAGRLIKESSRLSTLRVVFVRMDTNADLFFDKVQELNAPDLLQKLFRVTDGKQINRILNAWYDRRADATIASAYVEGDDLVLQACDLKRYRVRFEDLPGLAGLSSFQRKKLQIDDHGNHVFWPGLNVSVDLDVVRYKADDSFRRSKDMDALSDYTEFLGEAIRKVMSKRQLTQAELRSGGGPAERHLYRIERGEQGLTSAMIDRLSRAHGLSSMAYVEELISACDEIVEERAIGGF